MLPLLTGVATKMLGPSGSTTAKNKKISKEKLLKSSDLKDGKESVKITQKSVKLLPPAPKVSLLSPASDKPTLKGGPKKISTESLRDKGSYISKVLDNVIKYFKNKKKNTDKEIQQDRKTEEIDKKNKRESDLENKKAKTKGFSLQSASNISFLDRILNFFTSILIGSLLVFLLKNSKKIFDIFNDIQSGLNNIWDVIRIGIISLSVSAKGLIKNVAKLGKFLLKGPAKLTGNLIKNLGKSIKNVFKGLGKYVVNNIKRIAGLAAGAGSGTRGGGSKRVDPSKAKKPRATPKPLKSGTPKQTNPSVLNRAKQLFSDKGTKHLGKVSKVFKKIPFIGALIGIGIDLAMGERLDNAIAGAAGASLGAAIGAGVGSVLFPGLGTLAGGFLGGIVGDWAGKEIYKKLSGQITQINPPQSELISPELGGYSEKLQERLDSPIPFQGPPPGTVPSGRLSISQLVSLAKSVGFPDNEAAIMAAIAMGESRGNSNAHNDNYLRGGGDNSYGLWQINMIDTLGPDRRKKLGLTSNEQLKDPVTNARAALLVRNESGLSAWTVYKKGIYKQYLPDAQKALKTAQVIPSQPQPNLSQAPPAPILPSREELNANKGIVPQQYQSQSTLQRGQVSPQQSTRSSVGLTQQASYEQQTSPVVILGGGSQPSGGSYGSGGVVPLPFGIGKKELLNSYYQAQLNGFLYKQG